MTETEIAMRLALATLGAMLLGLDRELRGISAGLRTHGIVGLSSALITISALLLYESLHSGGSNPDVDPLRVVQGLAQAVGFIAAGAIFVSGGNVHNLTSAANLWLAAAVGIAAGAGQMRLAIIGLLIGLVLITLVRLLERYVLGGKQQGRDVRDDAPPGS